MDHLAARTYILDRLAAELPEDLPYHGLRHTIDVSRAAAEIAAAEGVDAAASALVVTAAAYHDAGFIARYHDNEPIGAALAREALPAFGFDPAAVAQVEAMILATHMPQQPHDPLAEILCDADLAYLGGDSYQTVSLMLRRELAGHGQPLALRPWYQLQEEFLTSHVYFTPGARALCEARKQEHLREIRELLHPAS